MKRGSGNRSALLVSMQLGAALAISMSAWKKTLTPLQYRVLRKKATEPAGSGRFNVHKEKGMYICGACRPGATGE